jgi:signal peptidase I
MDEQIANTKHRRKPFLAAFLSFLAFGLGHIYCGRIVRGFVAGFIGAILIPVLSYGILAGFSHVNMAALLILSLISLLFWVAVIIDSYLIARKIRPDYELKEYNRWYVYLIFYYLVISCASNITSDAKSNLIEAFRTPTLSMFPTFEYHDRFVANKKAYKNDDPKRGDIIVFISPENRQEVYVKRVVAIAGDTVEMKDNQLFINGEKLERESQGRATYIGKDSKKEDVKVEGELFIEKNDQAKYTIFLGDTYNSKVFPVDRRADFPEKKIPKNYCFVLGDSRNLSEDSRHFGSIPMATVKGRAEYLYWPAGDWSRFGPIK